MSNKKKLINKVFNKAKKDSGQTTKNALATYLWAYFEDHFGFEISDRTFIRYYDAYIENKNDEIRIEIFKLNKFSEYLGFTDYQDFVNNETAVVDIKENTIKHKFPIEGNSSDFKENIIHITIQNIIKIPEFFTKHKGMSLGAAGLMIAGGSFALNKPNETKPQLFASYSDTKFMYWEESRYKMTTAQDKNPLHKLMILDSVKIKYFKKNLRPDTLTVDNAMGKSWYSKYKNKVEFFTNDGINPDNNKELKPVTEHILGKYAGDNAEK